MKNFIVFDIGGTFIKWSVVSSDFQSLKSDKFAFDAANIPAKEMFVKIGALIKENEEKYNLSAIGISTAGNICPETTVVLGASNFKEYAGLNIRNEVTKYSNLPVFVENDANAAILGELVAGELESYKNILMVTLGTDIGGGLILNGQLYPGFRGLAGEVSFMNIEGRRWGSYFSARGLIKLVEEFQAKKMNPEEILKSEDVEIKAVVDYWYKGLAIGISNISYVINPEIVILGGGLSESNLINFKKLNKLVNDLQLDKFTILKSKNGNKAAIDGMVEIIKRNLNKK